MSRESTSINGLLARLRATYNRHRASCEFGNVALSEGITITLLRASPFALWMVLIRRSGGFDRIRTRGHGKRLGPCEFIVRAHLDNLSGLDCLKTFKTGRHKRHKIAQEDRFAANNQKRDATSLYIWLLLGSSVYGGQHVKRCLLSCLPQGAVLQARKAPIAYSLAIVTGEMIREDAQEHTGPRVSAFKRG